MGNELGEESLQRSRGVLVVWGGVGHNCGRDKLAENKLN